MSPTKFQLSREQRKRLLAGDYRPLSFSNQPTCEPGTVYVLSWSHARPSIDENGQVIRPDRERLLWIEITKVVRQTKSWTAWFTIHDHRDRTRYLRSTLPQFDPADRKRDLEQPPTAEEVRVAAEESAYTSDPRSALDRLPAVPLRDLDRYTAEASERDVERARRRREAWEERSLSDRLRKLENDPGLWREMRDVRRRIESAERKKRAA